MSPIINIESMPYEMAFAFFSRIIFNSWGSRDIAVQIPANTPIYNVRSLIKYVSLSIKNIMPQKSLPFALCLICLPAIPQDYPMQR